jgi:UDP-N-acetylmuramyl pentapeptide synthase
MEKDEIATISQAVLEMDAYVVETLPRVTRFFPLDMAILTSVNEQHLETFGGDIRNSIKANYNIFGGLKPEGKKLAIINADDENCRKIIDMLRREKPEVEIYTYGSSFGLAPAGESAQEVDALVGEVRSEHKPDSVGIAFELKLSARLGGEKLAIFLPVPGKFNAQNFAAASLAAILSGLPVSEVTQAAAEVTLRERNLQLRRVVVGSDNAMNNSNTAIGSSDGESRNRIAPTGPTIEIIDDSFSANPAGLWANLQLLSERNEVLPAKSIFITPGLEDLAGESVRIHSEIAAKATQLADYVIVTTSHGRDIQLAERPANLHLFEDPVQVTAKLEEILNNHKQENVRIFISGRVAAAIYKYINVYGI